METKKDIENLLDQEQKKDEQQRERRRKFQENPLQEEHLRREIPPDIRREMETLRRQNENLTELSRGQTMPNGHPDLGFDTGSQKGLGWRQKQEQKIREYFLRGATHHWVLWKIKRDTGCTTVTARAIIDDALEDEPEKKEPRGAPKK